MSLTEPSSPSSPEHRLWSTLGSWLKRGTHPAPWLSPRWHHPVYGYLVALLLEVFTAGVIVLLQMLHPALGFLDVLLVLIIVLVALSWGQGPSLLATVLGVIPLIFVITPPTFTWEVSGIPNFIDIGLYLATGSII